MNTGKKIRFITGLIAIAMVISLLAACSSTKETELSFLDLKLGISKTEVIGQLGEEYEELGTSPKRMSYSGLQLFDFVGKGTKTKTMVFLNLSDIAYSYTYYIYADIDKNEKKIKELLTGMYGECTDNDAGGVDWKNGDQTYSCIKSDDYVAISVY